MINFALDDAHQLDAPVNCFTLDYVKRDPRHPGHRLQDLDRAKAGRRSSRPGPATTRVPGAGNEVTHGTQATGFADDRAAVIWSGETTVADLRADLLMLASD